MTITDPTFYRSPAEAIAAPTEHLAYVVAFDRAGVLPDALAVLDVDENSGGYGTVVGWADVPPPATNRTSSGGTAAPAGSLTGGAALGRADSSAPSSRLPDRAAPASPSPAPRPDPAPPR